MIRKYRARDRQAVVQLVTSCDHMHPHDIQSVLDGDTVYLCEQKGSLVGVAVVNAMERTVLGKTCELYLLTAPAARKRGIGRTLWEKIWPSVLASDPDTVTVQYRLDEGDTRDFFQKRGFERWLTLHQMHYRGEKFPEPNLQARQYQDCDFDQYVQLLSDAFYNLRQENDCHPFALVDSVTNQSRSLLEQHRESLYVFTLGEEIIGSFAVKGPAEIDDLFVAPTFQGQGLGRKITQFAVNRMLERGANPVTLSVVTTNTNAYDMYESLGFQRVQTSEISRMTFKTP
ncbi:GNAT family N-acetyltransferase [Tumebacillus sp. ITR2]|uniref:GNAT family N-acetyltransferase n=1 Tax=Tumebacillus amylolyticus TaxID=2801339 RepID=A0ABS1JFX5_9BACL|nr:GNAT family N-acetyltransferase [Tumebacillus amylolyticus]MBL0388483.1 GNAT family N-acetyltransferase [Tumebacillus amylolyticus]